MSDTSVAAVDARQSMLRVWMALSAVWVAFWLLIAGIVFTAVGMQEPFSDELGRYAAIVVTPPAALFAVGVPLRWLFEALTRTARPQQGRKSPFA